MLKTKTQKTAFCVIFTAKLDLNTAGLYTAPMELSLLTDARQLLELAATTQSVYAKELKSLARRILLAAAAELEEPTAPSTPPRPPQSAVLVPPGAPQRPRQQSIEPPSPIAMFHESQESDDEEEQPAAVASVMTGTTAARNRKNFAKFVRTLQLANDTEFFYGSVKFLLAGAGTATPSLTFVHNGMRISSPAPSGIISQYEKTINKRSVTANGWDRLKMLDREDRPRPLSWEGWDTQP